MTVALLALLLTFPHGHLHCVAEVKTPGAVLSVPLAPSLAPLVGFLDARAVEPVCI